MSNNGDESNEEEVVVSLLSGELRGGLPERCGKVTNVTFGTELTNSPTKRGSGVVPYGIVEVATSPSKLRRG